MRFESRSASSCSSSRALFTIPAACWGVRSGTEEAHFGLSFAFPAQPSDSGLATGGTCTASARSPRSESRQPAVNRVSRHMQSTTCRPNIWTCAIYHEPGELTKTTVCIASEAG